MGVLVRTEFFKVASSRWQVVTLLIVLVLHVPLMFWTQAAPEAAWNGLRSRSGLFTGFAMMVFGALVVTQEYRYRTAMLTWLTNPSRRRVTIAQALTVSMIGLALSGTLFAAWLAVGIIGHGGLGLHTDRPLDILRAYGIVAVTVCAAGVVGVGVGTLTRSSSGALLALGASGAAELLSDVTRFRGPVTSMMGVLAWPTSELEPGALVAAVGWGVLALVIALFAVQRDVAS